MKDIQERGKQVVTGRKVLGMKVETIHYFENGENESTFHTDVADNCYARKNLEKAGMKELLEQYGRNTFVYLNPDGVQEVASCRMEAAKKFGYNGNGHTAAFLNRKGCRNVDGSRIQG